MQSRSVLNSNNPNLYYIYIVYKSRNCMIFVKSNEIFENKFRSHLILKNN